MKNLFKTYKVTKATSVAFDTYKASAYVSKEITASIPEGEKIVGDMKTKGDKQVLIIDPTKQSIKITDSVKNEPVTSLLEIPAENVKFCFPWWIVLVIVAIVGGGVVAYKKFKK
ncbi:MAG: hypothetical protein LBU90_03665 [Bacteroidales bacterium]|jgi:filamentous hemagglutinin family protein|nr:hypothetical protein [Bacteroidales bacterium]